MRSATGTLAGRFARPGRELLAAAAICLGTIGLSFEAARNPLLGLGAAAGLGLFVLTVYDLTLGANAFLVAQFVAHSLPVSQESLARLLGACLVASWLVAILVRGGMRRPPSLAREHPAMVVAMCLFLAWGLATTLWAVDPAPIMSTLQRYVLSMVLAVVLFAASPTRTTARRMMVVLVLALGASAALAYALGLSQGAGRLSGGTTDPNELAMSLLPAVVLGPALATYERGLMRAALLGSAALSGWSIVATQSRGGMVAVLVSGLVLVVVGGRWRWRVLGTVSAVGLAAITYVEVLAAPDVRQRILSVLSAGNDAASSSDASAGRTDIWAVGLKAFEAHPAAGSGLGDFTAVTPRYVFHAGLVRRTDFMFVTPKVAHNLYLHLLVEVGVIGLAIFSLILVASLIAAWTAVRRFALQGRRDLELLARATFASTIGLLVASFFLSSMFARILWVGLALGPVLAHAARTPDAQGEP